VVKFNWASFHWFQVDNHFWVILWFCGLVCSLSYQWWNQRRDC